MSDSIIRYEQSGLSPSYNPEDFEKDIYRFWEQSGCFDAADENKPGQKSFCIVIPPPNVTGVLHIGHALTNTIQDILIRWRRMCGDNALWLPGTDHAGIATQTQVEKAIAKEGKGPSGKPLTRYDLGREKFLERTWKWKEDHGNKIGAQQRRLGNSLDWKRERFTMDEGFSSAVREVFVRLFEEGLIYRGERIINWDVKSQTALSDLEVIPTERKSHLWNIRYLVFEDAEGKTPVKDKMGNPASLIVATTRPETLLGDTAVAIHPEDERYQFARGKFARVPLINRIVRIIEDDYVDLEFGTGALKVTPSHDFNDYDLGIKHQLEFISVLGKDGKVTASGGEYQGLKFKDAREKIVEDLDAAGLLHKVEDYTHKVGISQRSNEIVEPIMSKQWFVKIDPLAKPAIKAVEDGSIEFSPKTWEKTYFEWMYNIRDWCISRQLWWGHQIPAWYCLDCDEATVSRNEVKSCPKCKSPNLKQDDDVLDTWFSSGLWPFATMGWPEKTKSLNTFYPNAVLETGFDIIFFWVARMIMMGIHFMGEPPFKKVYLHAMVRDSKGEKMSKSKGNVIDPMDFIESKGADSLRFTLAIMAGQGRDVKLSESRVDGYRAFCNKIWNATKFFLLNWERRDDSEELEKVNLDDWVKDHFKNLDVYDRWIITKMNEAAEQVHNGLDRFELNVASQSVYQFIWNELCDWYIELSKKRLDEDRSPNTILVLRYVLEGALRMGHPFMPFVTEKLWQSLPIKTVSRLNSEDLIETLMLQKFPQKDASLMDLEAVREVDSLKACVEGIRNFRGENKVSPKTKIKAQYESNDTSLNSMIKNRAEDIRLLCGLSELNQGSDFTGKVVLTKPSIEFSINLEGVVDKKAEATRIRKEIEKVSADIAHVTKKLSNPSFVDKAPPQVVAKEKEKQAGLEKKLQELDQSLKQFEGPSS